MKNKKLLIMMGSLIGLMMIVLIIILISNFNNDKKEMLENEKIISESYERVKEEVINYNKIRKDVSEFINNFYYSTISKEYSNNLDKFKEYDEIVNNITNEIFKIDSRCNQIYQDKDINNICDNYKNDYETIVNVFVNDMNNYNNKLTNYNNNSNSNLDLFKSSYINDYIDYNNDNIYLKRDEVND